MEGPLLFSVFLSCAHLVGSSDHERRRRRRIRLKWAFLPSSLARLNSREEEERGAWGQHETKKTLGSKAQRQSNQQHAKIAIDYDMYVGPLAVIY